MRCARCQFENIPGQARCLRCGSILEVGSGVIQIYPPRMPVWRRPFRNAMRRLRGWRLVPERLPLPIRRALDWIASDNVLGPVLSLVPGLAHLLRGRFGEVKWFVLLWVLLVSAGVFCYGSIIGFLLIGAAVGLHAWMIARFRQIRNVVDLSERVVTAVVVAVLLVLLYWGAPRLVFSNYTGVRATLNIPGLHINRGDYLLARRMTGADRGLPRGTLVLVHPAHFRHYHRVLFTIGRATALGQIIGFPYETVQIEDGVYTVGKRPLDPNLFPVPGWLANQLVSVRVPKDSYFISSPYTVNIRDVKLDSGMVGNACLFQAEDIGGQAFMRWWPPWRRGFIE